MERPHNENIIDQFTRQAVPFASAPAIRNSDALATIVRMACAGPADNVLDVACGPGLLVCAFAKVVRHAVGIDITPAMLDQARKLQGELRLENISWQLGDVQALPYPDGHFSIVASRFALHHLQNPLAVLREMRRVCVEGGSLVVADSAPASAKADAFNRLEKLRDPSHVRAFPVEELQQMFADAGLAQPEVESYRLQGELEDLLQRSFPNAGDSDRIRAIFTDSLATDALDMATEKRGGKIYYGFPVAVLATRC
jgi:SAM-dependent methyltransferase